MDSSPVSKLRPNSRFRVEQSSHAAESLENLKKSHGCLTSSSSWQSFRLDHALRFLVIWPFLSFAEAKCSFESFDLEVAGRGGAPTRQLLQQQL
jgi:hypothetical protein